MGTQGREKYAGPADWQSIIAKRFLFSNQSLETLAMLETQSHTACRNPSGSSSSGTGRKLKNPIGKPMILLRHQSKPRISGLKP